MHMHWKLKAHTLALLSRLPGSPAAGRRTTPCRNGWAPTAST